VTIIVEAPSDDLAAWIGVAGVAVGVVLTTGVEWLRDSRGQRRQLRRDARAAADELAAAAETMAALALSVHAPHAKERDPLAFTLALLSQQERVNTACVTIMRLLPPQVAEAAHNVRDAALATAEAAQTERQHAIEVHDQVNVAVNAFYAALREAGF
jgi:hypothetical protein